MNICLGGADALIQNLTSEVMTCFFVLSGFSLYYSYNSTDMQNIGEIIKFYKKRAIGILPAYYLTHFLWCFFMEESLLKGIQLLPVELLGIQTMYNSLFGILHNGGTWFISCILLCYFFYPLMQELVKVMPNKLKIIVAFITIFVLIYSNYVIAAFSLGSNYSNPMYRGLEFSFGVFLGAIVPKIILPIKDKIKNLINLIVCALAVIVVLYYNYQPIIVVCRIALQDIIFLPLLSIIMFTSYNIRCQTLEKSKMLAYMSKISYYFYLLQLFLWKVSATVLVNLGLSGNLHKICVSFVCCVILAVMNYEVFDKPIQKLLSKKILNDRCKN